jgi:chromosome segregation ATPase
MNKQDIDKAFSAFSGAKRTFEPILTALSQADEVLSIMSNAIVLQDSLLTDTAKLKLKSDELTKQVSDLQVEALSGNAAVEQAKNQAAKDIADAKEQAKVQVKTILDAVAAKTKSAQDAFEAKQAELTNKATQLQSEFDASSAALTAQKTDLEAQIATLQKKLDSITAQAKKFADSIAG